MILAVGMTLEDGRREFPGVLYDMVTLNNNEAKKGKAEEEEEDE